jgi:hypothetical protein
MLCAECRKLQDEEENAMRALQEQGTVNRECNLHGKQAKKVERDLEKAYDLARAKNRLHKRTYHPEEGHTVSIVRAGRSGRVTRFGK